ncbi:uncharacterized protein F5147DRAFT_204880 [Suillus discolor]|uniref:Beta-flanking protein n=1 Tax=Suillus discolor TaxID=1912936 RepID=A0A9P7JTK0_9AGAM|nr:uncharacterized protein F5147DRAFT_204880 [Suillus discolor]KAG2107412.1 hypothetical protein F5147DRAFT_204880 [Suillus discolor]
MHHQREGFGRHEGREERLQDRREQFGERLHDRREALEERRFGHGRHGEHSEERRHERYEDHRRDPDQQQQQYAPPAGGFNRADFVSDEDFKRMMHGGGGGGGAGFEQPRRGGNDIGPEDFGEWDRQRPPQNAGYQESYQQQSVPHEQRTSGYESGAYAQPSRNQYSDPESLDPRYGSNVYAPPAGPPGASSSYAPAGGYAPPPGPPPPGTRPQASYGYDASPQGGSGRGAANDYYNGPPPGQSAQPYSHTPDNATAYNDSPNAPRYQAQPSDGFDDENYKSHFSAHAQAYGSDHDDRPMANDAIGAAAAIEALKLTAANNQSGNRPQQGGRPQGGFHADANAPHATPSAGGAQQSSDMSGRPSGGKPQGQPQNAEFEPESDDEGPAAKAQAPAGGGGMQGKIVALAMAQAGKLFDKKGGGDSQGKTQAMQSAAATAMRLMGEYKSTGKVNMEPGEMQKLMGVAMSLF